MPYEWVTSLVRHGERVFGLDRLHTVQCGEGNNSQLVCVASGGIQVVTCHACQLDMKKKNSMCKEQTGAQKKKPILLAVMGVLLYAYPISDCLSQSTGSIS